VQEHEQEQEQSEAARVLAPLARRHARSCRAIRLMAWKQDLAASEMLLLLLLLLHPLFLSRTPQGKAN
jgi:hypothetical protein